MNLRIDRRMLIKKRFTLNLKNDIHHQNITNISATLSCKYLSNYQISQSGIRFKERYDLLTSGYIYDFCHQLTIQKSNNI
jgi:hypothetical protein